MQELQLTPAHCNPESGSRVAQSRKNSDKIFDEVGKKVISARASVVDYPPMPYRKWIPCRTIQNNSDET